MPGRAALGWVGMVLGGEDMVRRGGTGRGGGVGEGVAGPEWGGKVELGEEVGTGRGE